MTATAVDAALAYYARHGAALFPIPAGQKAPFGIVESFKHDHSADPKQWDAWRAANPGCNFGVVAFASRWIIVDIDVTELGRDAAWSAWVERCAEWDMLPLTPHVQSARGGWHVYFSVPPEIDASALRQRDAEKSVIQTRCVGFTVAAGSYYDGTARNEQSGWYTFLSDAAPYPAPPKLLEHVAPAAPRTSTSKVGERDRGDVAAMLKWMAEREHFASYEDWLNCGMALKIEFGDDGLDLWRLTFDDTVTADVEASKWQSFAGEPNADSVTINSLMLRAHRAGWVGQIRKSTAAMFDTVAQLAAQAGATLPSSGNGAPSPAVPMLQGQAALAEIGTPVLAGWLAANADLPTRPIAATYPNIPDGVPSDLVPVLRLCVDRIAAMAENPKTWKLQNVVEPSGILQHVHAATYDAIRRHCIALGRTWPDSPIRLYATAIEEKVQRACKPRDQWIRDHKGEIVAKNSDNLEVFMGIIGCELRWNAWLERAEIRGDEWHFWTHVDDAVHARLSTRAAQTATEFHPSDTNLWKWLLTLAKNNVVDPAIDHIAACEAAWDRQHRLSIWLSATCGVPPDLYHQAVGRSIIGGIVRRIREPGCKHDPVAVFIGPQGNLKSTLAATLAMRPVWFSDTVLLGDEAKELVLSLAGVSVAEIGEMSTRGAGEMTKIKAMLSRQVDRGRPAYGRAVVDRPRRNIFIGTTNDDKPLTDHTGNRRFLPVRVPSEINLAWLKQNLDQLIGEAAALHTASGCDFGIPREAWGIAAEHQEAARTRSDVEVLFEDWFGETPHTRFAYIVASDLTMLATSGSRTLGNNSLRGAALRDLGFREERITANGKTTRLWVRGGENVRPAEIMRQAVRYQIGQGTDGRARVAPILAAGEAGGNPPPLPG